MRKIVILSFISLDGIMQAPGGPDEDTSGDFKYGGWSFSYSDEVSGGLMLEQMCMDYDLLLGRKTYDIFSNFWPQQDPDHPIAKPFNKAIKYVVSNSKPDLTWEKSMLIDGDVIAKLRELKEHDGPMLQVHGSGNLTQTLLKNDLVDELWLKIYPLTLGSGKHLFSEGTIAAGFELIDSKTTPKGVIFANYKRAGEVKTGTFD